VKNLLIVLFIFLFCNIACAESVKLKTGVSSPEVLEIEKDPSSKEDENCKEANRYAKLAEEAYKRREYKQAIEYLVKALDYNPKELDAYSLLSQILTILERYDDAIIYAKKAIEINPNIYKPYFHMGMAYFAMKDYEKSLNSLESAKNLKVDKLIDEALIYYFLGHDYGYVKNLKKSKENYEFALPLFVKLGDKKYVESAEKQIRDLKRLGVN
jgi:tetratricopeptide (TPR) repeat protein